MAVGGKKRFSKRKILLGVSGSIAAYKACEVIRDLREEGADVTCLMTPSAQKFITPLTLKALSANPVYTDPFSNEADWAVLHTTLADEADLILVCPASANLIARLASGMADDLISSVILASRAKVLIVPAMNDNMYAHAITQENISKLRKIYHFTDPIKGELVCGRKGLGHIADTRTILEKAYSVLNLKK